MKTKIKRDPKLEDFYTSLIIKQNVNYVEKVGLQDTSMNVVQIADNEIGVKEIFIYTDEGTQLLNNKFSRPFGVNSEKFYANIKNFIFTLQKLCRVDNNFNFHKIYLNGLKIIFLIKSYIVVCGIFSENGSTILAKLYLYFIFSSFSNYCNSTILTLRKINMEGLSTIFSIRDKNNKEKVQKKIILQNLEFFPIKIFQDYLAKPLTYHFNKVFKCFTKKEDLELANIKFKNMYIIDPNNREIVFDLMASRKAVKNKKYYKNERLWSELMYHSNNLLNSYKNNVGMEYDHIQKATRFVKFESTSTFPRLTFIIKFLPILKGMTIIHIYSQNKLSRGECNEKSSNIKQYKEVDILYGTEIKENSSIEFKYVEPQKLTDIEDFFTEFYVANHKNSELFYRRSNKLLYFDDILLNKINDLILDNIKNFTIEAVYNKLNNYLYEIYSKNRQTMYNDAENKGNKKENKEFMFFLTKEDVVKEFFKELDKKMNMSKLDATLNLSKIDEVVAYDGNEISVDLYNKLSLITNKEDDVLPSFVNNYKNNNTSFSGIIMNDIESRGNHQYEPIDNSIVNNKLEIVNNEKKNNVFETKNHQKQISVNLNKK